MLKKLSRQKRFRTFNALINRSLIILMKRGLSYIGFALLICCSGKPSPEATENEAVEIDSAKEFYAEEAEDKTVYDYRSFQGIYDHESTTRSFSAILTIEESGNDLSFTLSVSQGSCKGEALGKITIVSHEENYHAGFFELDECPMQFSLMLKEEKIDVKEINLCRLHESNCAFEGTYVKRKT